MEPDFAAVLKSDDRGDYRDQIVRFTRRLGFDRVTALSAIDRPGGVTDFDSVDNAPSGYRSDHSDPERAKLDPVMQHCKHHSLPIIWDQSTYLNAGQIELWEAQAEFGYRNGIAVTLHMTGGRHYMLGVDRDRALTTDAVELTRLVSSLQLFAVYANEADSQIRRSETRVNDPKLTRRELELLRLTAEGMTAQQAAVSLGIGGRTAACHLMRATRKLRCVNKLQAAVHAVRLGLLQL
jgi:DNA-binding CsgD family transcriptional regulator